MPKVISEFDEKNTRKNRSRAYKPQNWTMILRRIVCVLYIPHSLVLDCCCCIFFFFRQRLFKCLHGSFSADPVRKTRISISKKRKKQNWASSIAARLAKFLFILRLAAFLQHIIKCVHRAYKPQIWLKLIFCTWHISVLAWLF